MLFEIILLIMEDNGIHLSRISSELAVIVNVYSRRGKKENFSPKI